MPSTLLADMAQHATDGQSNQSAFWFSPFHVLAGGACFEASNALAAISISSCSCAVPAIGAADSKELLV